MTHVKLFAVAVAAVLGLPVHAQTQSTPRIDRRQANQEQRIQQGVNSGELNRKEAARLEKGQARVQKMEDKAMADGKVTKKEARQVERAQDRQSRKIHREKHDK